MQATTILAQRDTDHTGLQEIAFHAVFVYRDLHAEFPDVGFHEVKMGRIVQWAPLVNY